jgi:hypothetical protein
MSLLLALLLLAVIVVEVLYNYYFAMFVLAVSHPAASLVVFEFVVM